MPLLFRDGRIVRASKTTATAVVLIAVVANRRAIPFRALALAAMIVLMTAPEALVQPSFQSLSAS